MERDCIFDICLTQDVGVAEDALATEILKEKVNAKGIPVFMGHGRCLDSEGRHFAAFATSLRTEDECREVLRSLSFTKGVLGAQIRRTSTCEVLVVRGSDPTGVVIPGGWGAYRSSPRSGEGLVSGILRDPSWSCWQLD
mmetsp:Transcript_72043/g.233023  ORF Transcript_72043/g.233023 Transcript_72043/m.233023 type:complete len:139 (+) Transcript_72043:1-417(+)